MPKTIQIAIDGPSGAGKSTMARRIAQTYGYLYIDTGALYRAIGYKILESGGHPNDPDDVLPVLSTLSITLRHIDGEQRVFVDGEDVSDSIRTPEVSMAASDVSAIPAVRAYLLDLQRDLARQNNVVMDGRDIGTVVLPDAQIKIFLTAEAEDRARRRYEQMLEGGQQADYETVLADVKRRDYNDSHRQAAPLRQAEDAIRVDTTGCTLEEGTAKIRAAIENRMIEEKMIDVG